MKAMTDKNVPGHRLEEAVAYRDGLLGEAERAAFEAHLADCPACRDDLRAAETVLTGLRDRMARGIAGGYSTDEILARMKRKEAELGRGVAGPRFQWPVWAAVGLVAAAILLALALALRTPPAPAPRQEIAQPQQPLPKKRLMAPLPEPNPDAGQK
jgi:anti-sigma factor RsiW